MNKLITYLFSVFIFIGTIHAVKGQSEYDSLFVDSVLANIVQEYHPTGFLKFYPDVMAPGDMYAMYPDVFFYDDNNTLELTQTLESQSLNLKHFKYQQFCDGIEVEGAQIIEHAENEGSVIWMTGKVTDSLTPPDSTQILSEAAALDSLLEWYDGFDFAWQDSTWEAWIKLEFDDDSATYYPSGELVYALDNTSNLGFHIDSSRYTLTWKFNILALSPHLSADVYVDAYTGDVVYERRREHSNGQADLLHHHGTKTIDTKFKGGFTQKHILLATDNGRNFETRQYMGTTWRQLDDVKDGDDRWFSNVEEHTSPHWFIQQSWDYFASEHGHVGPDGFGIEQLQIWSNMSEETVEDKRSGPAFYEQVEVRGDVHERIMVGTFEGDYYATIDVMGHEFTHSVIKNTSNLGMFNIGESKALNESFCDIFGVMIERFAEGNINDWTTAEDATNNWQLVRDLSDPNSSGRHFGLDCNTALQGQPDTRLGQFWQTTCPDSEIHTNGGPQNYWFHLLTDGGAGTNDNGDSYNIQGVGADDAAELVFLTMTTLGFAAQYMDVRIQSIQMAELLSNNNACANLVIQTTNAWAAVGVGGISTCAGSNVFEDAYALSKPKIFPNPTNKEVTVQFSESEEREIELLNLSGQVVLVKESMDQDVLIEVSEIPVGTYVLRVSSSKGTHSQRLVVY